MCLYGHPNETWEVSLPAEEVPPELPEPALGINFARDGMHRRDWLSLVAVHSDSWLLSVAFYLGARLNRNERYTLILMEVYMYGDSSSGLLFSLCQRYDQTLYRMLETWVIVMVIGQHKLIPSPFLDIRSIQLI